MSGDRRNAETSFINGDMSLETVSEQGEVVVGRDLSAPIVDGEVKVHSWQDLGDDFVGFALYDAGGDELLRWGVGSANDVSGVSQGSVFVYSLLGEAYVIMDDGGVEQMGEGPALALDEANYSLTWEQVAGGLAFSLSIVDGWGTERGWGFADLLASGATSVASVGVVASGDKRITFDTISVSGTPVSAVPEQGTLALLAAGAALLAGRRRLRRA